MANAQHPIYVTLTTHVSVNGGLTTKDWHEKIWKLPSFHSEWLNFGITFISYLNLHIGPIS
jgi:hypothetical protein